MSRQGRTDHARDPLARSAAEGREAVIRVDADMTSCEQIRQFFLRCSRCIREGAGAMRIDLRQVTLVDTKLVACLVAIYQLAQASSMRMELQTSRAVLDAVDLCRLNWLIEKTAPRA